MPTNSRTTIRFEDEQMDLLREIRGVAARRGLRVTINDILCAMVEHVASARERYDSILGDLIENAARHTIRKSKRHKRE